MEVNRFVDFVGVSGRNWRTRSRRPNRTSWLRIWTRVDSRPFDATVTDNPSARRIAKSRSRISSARSKLCFETRTSRHVSPARGRTTLRPSVDLSLASWFPQELKTGKASRRSGLPLSRGGLCLFRRLSAGQLSIGEIEKGTRIDSEAWASSYSGTRPPNSCSHSHQ